LEDLRDKIEEGVTGLKEKNFPSESNTDEEQRQFKLILDGYGHLKFDLDGLELWLIKLLKEETIKDKRRLQWATWATWVLFPLGLLIVVAGHSAGVEVPGSA